jgi:hypothetical protein
MSTYNPTNVVNNIAYPAQASRARVSDANGYVGARATRDGTLYAADWRQALVLEGRAFHVTVGALTTPITGGGAGTVIDAEQPEVLISIPSGTSIMPLRIHVETQPGLIANDADELEILIAVDRTQAISGGTSTAEVVFNMRTDNPAASLCTVTSAYTADMVTPATPVLGIELARKQLQGDVQGTAANAQYHVGELLYVPEPAPIIVGPAALLIYWAGTVAVPGYAQVEWAEFVTATDITA